MPTREQYDLVVIGAGPAGQKAAVQGAKIGKQVLLVDREGRAGGECVHRGTIPSKTLRETALYLSGLERRATGLTLLDLGPTTKVQSLMRRLEQVLPAHEHIIEEQLERNGIETVRGRASFVDPHTLEFLHVDGSRSRARGRTIVIATGSRPRTPPEIPVDHETILDSDSILSLIYLPESLVVLGGGVIACEFATIFQAVGTRVTLIDRGERPLSFMDPEITGLFVESFESAGGRFLSGRACVGVDIDPLEGGVISVDDGTTCSGQKVLVALGRRACLEGLKLERVGLAPSPRGYLPVDEFYRTAVPHIYGVGDVIGPPALAASSMEQGRRAVRHAFGLDVQDPLETIPTGIYTIPEMASVGLSEAQARERHGAVVVGHARYEEIARGVINGDTRGMAKLVVDAATGRVLGGQVIGEGATEIIHLVQLAILGGLPADVFVDHAFNFPTMAEAWRVAALDAVSQRALLRAQAA